MARKVHSPICNSWHSGCGWRLRKDSVSEVCKNYNFSVSPYGRKWSMVNHVAFLLLIVVLKGRKNNREGCVPELRWQREIQGNSIYWFKNPETNYCAWAGSKEWGTGDTSLLSGINFIIVKLTLEYNPKCLSLAHLHAVFLKLKTSSLAWGRHGAGTGG